MAELSTRHSKGPKTENEAYDVALQLQLFSVSLNTVMIYS